jgi:protein phosphatase
MASHRGKIRPGNEDACHMAVEDGLFILSDGMGGRNGGKTAADMVVAATPSLIQRELRGRRAIDYADSDGASIPEVIQQAILSLNEMVRTEGIKRPDLHGMGATLVMMLLTRNAAYVAHVGDSRAYLLRAEQLHQLTVDHTWAEFLVSERAISADQAASHPGSHQLMKYIGAREDPIPDVQNLTLSDGDTVLLCSDGLTGMVTEADIEQILLRSSEPQVACDALVDAALRGGGQDNVSVIVIDVESPSAN